MRILGIDPGLVHTGWGVIEYENGTLSYIAHGVINPPCDADLGLRLSKIFNDLQSVLKTFSPYSVGVEETFLNTNPKTTLKLGMARSIALMTPYLMGLHVSEYTANKVKKTVVGAGHADKTQIFHMIKVLLPQAPNLEVDAADALAVAITHAHHLSSVSHTCSHDCQAHRHR